MRGADALVRGLAAHGAGSVFALSGNQIMPVFDALFDHDMRLVHTRHEAATVHMAEAHAQLTGRIGVALVTAGGGLGNASGALIAAQTSDTPVLLLSGDSPVSGDGRGAFQEMDQTGMTRGLTKASHRIMQADDMAETVAWALDLAQSGRPGPVHLALPADVLTQQVTSSDPAKSDSSAKPPTLPDMAAFYGAERPLVVLGSALSETRAPGLARALQNALCAPVLVMESPRGLNDPSLGRVAEVAGGTTHVLCIGKPVDFTLQFGKPDTWRDAQTWDVILGDAAQIDMARGNLGSRLRGAVEAPPLEAARELAGATPRQVDRAAWMQRVAHCIAARVEAPRTDAVTPTTICLAVQERMDRAARATLICDGGEFGQWAQACLTAPRRIINGTSGVIGAALGYAIGAKAADPDATIVALMGDGCVGFHLSEFETAVRANLPFVAVVGNDRRWNAEHLIQTRSFGADRQIGCDLSGARYDLAVRALGGYGAHVTALDQLPGALDEAIASGLPACVNVEMQGAPAPTF